MYNQATKRMNIMIRNIRAEMTVLLGLNGVLIASESDLENKY